MAACRVEGGAAFWPLLMDRYAHISSNLTGLPSWVPDFSGHAFKNEVQGRGDALSNLVRDTYISFAYVAFPGRSLVAAVRGMCVDSIECTMKTIRKIDLQDDTDVRNIIQNMLQLESVLNMDEKIFRTLFGSEQYSWLCEIDSMFPPRDGTTKDNELRAIPSWIGQFFLKYIAGEFAETYHSFRKFVRDAFTHRFKTFADAAAYSDAYKDEAALRFLVAKMSFIVIETSRRHVFRTAGGRLGFAPARVMPGHRICMIPGHSCSLHIVSSDKKTYITAGATVEGLMGDELLNILPLHESGWEIFLLH